MRRMRFLQAAVFVSFMLLVAGLFFFQVVQGDTYVKLASQNRLRILRILPPRGSIVDINGAPLAVNVRTFNINGYPIDLQKEENIKSVTALLVRNGIPMTEDKFRETVAKQYSAPYRRRHEPHLCAGRGDDNGQGLQKGTLSDAGLAAYLSGGAVCRACRGLCRGDHEGGTRGRRRRGLPRRRHDRQKRHRGRI